MSTPEHGELIELGRELVEEIGRISMDVFLRSGLPVTTEYSEIYVDGTPAPSRESVLLVVAVDGGYHVSYTESQVVDESIAANVGESSTVNIVGGRSFRVKADGTGLDFLNPTDASVADEVRILIGTLPDFIGAPAQIGVNVPAATTNGAHE